MSDPLVVCGIAVGMPPERKWPEGFVPASYGTLVSTTESFDVEVGTASTFSFKGEDDKWLCGTCGHLSASTGEDRTHSLQHLKGTK